MIGYNRLEDEDWGQGAGMGWRERLGRIGGQLESTAGDQGTGLKV